MNTLCRRILQSYKNEDADGALKNLIDSILHYNGGIENLNEEDLKQPLLDDAEAEAPITETLDYRIMSVEFQNFRTFPGKEGVPYGVCFSRKEEPCSVFLVGKNGTGKSTIFDALELIYSGKVRNAEDRGIKELSNLQKYLTYGFGTIDNITTEESKLKIKLKDERILKDDWIGLGSVPALCVPALCCSEMDIEEISKLDDVAKAYNLPQLLEEGTINTISESDLQRYIRGQLGYQDLTSLRDVLMRIVKDAAQRISDANKRQRLAELTSADVKVVQKAFTKMTECSKPEWKNWYEEVEQYSEKEHITSIADADRPEQQLDVDKTIFPDQWKELLSNVQNLRQQRHPETEVGAYMQMEGESDKPEMQENLHNVIRELTLKMTAMYKLIKSAWDTYQEHHQENGLFIAMESLSKDYNELVDNVSKLPIHAEELRNLMINDRREVRAMAQLINKLNTTMANLFKGQDTSGTNSEGYIDDLNKFVERILNNYQDKSEIFHVTSTSNSFEVMVHVTDENGDYFESNPRRYLNTFRYRLYAVLLKIALSLYYMKSNHCVAPIIIDDVFNASDFENSASLSTFVHHIIEIYQDVIGGDIPLQLIILTHDEMIVNAFSEGVKLKSRKMKEREDGGMPHQEDYCLIGRLFPYTDAERLNKEVGSNSEFMNLYLLKS